MKIYLDNCCFNRPFDDQGKKKPIFSIKSVYEKLIHCILLAQLLLIVNII